MECASRLIQTEKKINPIVKTYTALWDTGATSSSITKKVIDELNLISTGVTKIYHANGSDTVDTYMVNIILPNNVGFKCLDVTEGKLNGTDVLIGMDIISNGDFIISNINDKTTFGFRLPSSNQISFQNEEYNNHIIIKPYDDKFEQLCPCGSGLKYKECHGKGLEK